jgi:hypothetical protein
MANALSAFLLCARDIRFHSSRLSIHPQAVRDGQRIHPSAEDAALPPQARRAREQCPLQINSRRSIQAQAKSSLAL